MSACFNLEQSKQQNVVKFSLPLLTAVSWTSYSVMCFWLQSGRTAHAYSRHRDSFDARLLPARELAALEPEQMRSSQPSSCLFGPAERQEVCGKNSMN